MTGSISGLASSIAANLIQFVDAYYFPGGETDLAKHLQGEIDDYYKRAPMADPQELQRQLDIVKEALGNVRFTANEALSEASRMFVYDQQFFDAEVHGIEQSGGEP